MAPDSRARPRVLVLRCKACTAELPAASNDVAFRCPQCGRTWEILHGAFREWTSVYVAPPSSTSHPIVYLPYWSFTVDATALPIGPGHESMLTARRGRDRIASARPWFRCRA